MDWPFQRRRMVDLQLRARGIRDQRVLAAMLDIPREEFVPEEFRHLSYSDEPVSIGYGQTISQPYMTALMAECLELTGTETVLEVGAGSGYHAAVLGALALEGRVITLELIGELAEAARRNLERTGRAHNITVLHANGSLGHPECAPYRAISVAAAAPHVPPALLGQLADPGVLVMPVGSLWDQELRVIRKSGGQVHSRVATYCRFVPLRSAEVFHRRDAEDAEKTQRRIS